MYAEVQESLYLEKALKAIASPRRLHIMQWLQDVAANFPAQVHGDPVEHGACNLFITDKLEVSQPAASRHMNVLVDAGLVVPTARSGWVYYRRNEPVVDALKHQLLAL